MTNPAHALKLGVGYLPGDRQKHAAFPNLSVAENLDVLVAAEVARWGFICLRRQAALVVGYYTQFKIKAHGIDAPIRTLSGGNQQKVILARTLAANPNIFVFHDSTQRVDIVTKKEVYTVIDALARRGRAILVVSSDLEEILVTCDRIVALHAGPVALNCSRAGASQETILAAATSSPTT